VQTKAIFIVATVISGTKCWIPFDTFFSNFPFTMDPLKNLAGNSVSSSSSSTFLKDGDGESTYTHSSTKSSSSTRQEEDYVVATLENASFSRSRKRNEENGPKILWEKNRLYCVQPDGSRVEIIPEKGSNPPRYDCVAQCIGTGKTYECNVDNMTGELIFPK